MDRDDSEGSILYSDDFLHPRVVCADSGFVLVVHLDARACADRDSVDLRVFDDVYHDLAKYGGHREEYWFEEIANCGLGNGAIFRKSWYN